MVLICAVTFSLPLADVWGQFHDIDKVYLDPPNPAGFWSASRATLVSDEVVSGVRAIRLMPEPCMSEDGCRVRVEFMYPFPKGLTIIVRTSAGTQSKVTTFEDSRLEFGRIEFDLEGAKSEISELVNIRISSPDTNYSHNNPIRFHDGGTEIMVVILDQYRNMLPISNEKNDEEVEPMGSFKLPLSEGLQVRQNPATGSCAISFTGEQDSRIHILNVHGQLVLDQGIPYGTATSLDLSHLAPGNYFLYEKGKSAKPIRLLILQ